MKVEFRVAIFLDFSAFRFLIFVHAIPHAIRNDENELPITILPLLLSTQHATVDK